MYIMRILLFVRICLYFQMSLIRDTEGWENMNAHAQNQVYHSKYDKKKPV
jgi:hypothetical protein